MPAVYLDSSAIVKLAVREPESDALRRHLRRRRPWVSSALARAEVLRALLPIGDRATAAGRAVLARCDLVRVNDRVLTLAGEMLPAELRSLDAIHLATAKRLGDDISELVVYDERMAVAARQLGYRVSSPS
jgi:predicted nucleic acid-binding protein